MIKLFIRKKIIEIKLKYYNFNYNRFFRMGVTSPYYKEKIKSANKEKNNINKQIEEMLGFIIP